MIFFTNCITYNKFIFIIYCNLYPFLEFFSVKLYTFGFTLSITFFLFIWMLKKLSWRFNYDFNLFKDNVLYFFISIFVFSRLFYVLAQWNDMKFIKNPFEFFIMSDYNFSLFWALFGFLLLLLINLKFRKENITKYLDWVVLSFLFVAFIWYIGALFWWQIYWKPTNLWIEIIYTNSFSQVPYTVPIFPLPIVYAVLTFLLFSILYILKMYIKTKWLVWYLWLWIFACLNLILEFFSWKDDFFSVNFFINFNQFCSLILLFFVWRILYWTVKNASFEWIINIID